MFKRECRGNRRSNSTGSTTSGESSDSSTSGLSSTSSTSSSRSSICSLPKNALYRIVVMGAAGVGKSSIVSQFLYDQFLADYKPTVEEIHRGEYEINSVSLTLDILDTSGSYQFPAMRELAIKTGDAFLLVYSLDDDESFDDVCRLRDEILKHKPDELVPIVVVGNKSDLIGKKRALLRESVEALVNIDWGNGYVEASAKDSESIVSIFKELLTQGHVHYALSPAIRRRRNCYVKKRNTKQHTEQQSGKRNNCTIC